MAAKSKTTVKISQGNPGVQCNEKKSQENYNEEPFVSSENEDSLAWKFLSSSQINEMLVLSASGVEKKMEDILNLKHHETCLKQGVILDYYVSGFWWAKEMNFTVQQISSFMTVLHIMLENLSNKSMLLEDSIKELAKLLAGIGIPGSEKSACLDFFSVDQACAVISYLKTSLFQPYKLYEFLFKHPRDEVVLGAEEKVELVITAEGPYPCPLEEGIPYDYFSRFIMPPPTEEAADKMIQQPTQESEDSEIAYETTEMDPMACYTMEDVKLVLGQVTSEVIGSLQSEINEKLRLQEETYTARIEKIKKV